MQHTPEAIITWLDGFGFGIERTESYLIAGLEIPREGRLSLTVDLRGKTFDLCFYERVASQSLLSHQMFEDDEHLMSQLKSNYLFDELVLTRTTGAGVLLDAVMLIQAEWISRDMGDLAPLVAAIKREAAALFAAQSQSNKPRSPDRHCLSQDTNCVEQTE